MVRIIKKLGLEEKPMRGKGSERLIVNPATGASFPIRHHKDSEDVPVPVIRAMLRRFDVTVEQWMEAKG
jgi:hypothetical protein